MNPQTKSILISGLISGIVYAVLMAGFDYYDEKNFKVWRFIFNFVFLGILIGLVTRYNFKKEKINEKH